MCDTPQTLVSASRPYHLGQFWGYHDARVTTVPMIATPTLGNRMNSHLPYPPPGSSTQPLNIDRWCSGSPTEPAARSQNRHRRKQVTPHGPPQPQARIARLGSAPSARDPCNVLFCLICGRRRSWPARRRERLTCGELTGHPTVSQPTTCTSSPTCRVL